MFKISASEWHIWSNTAKAVSEMMPHASDNSFDSIQPIKNLLLGLNKVNQHILDIWMQYLDQNILKYAMSMPIVENFIIRLVYF